LRARRSPPGRNLFRRLRDALALAIRRSERSRRALVRAGLGCLAPKLRVSPSPHDSIESVSTIKERVDAELSPVLGRPCRRDRDDRFAGGARCRLATVAWPRPRGRLEGDRTYQSVAR